MDEIKYLSDVNNQTNSSAEISQQNQITDNHHHQHHHKYSNSNTHFSDLKYLHKKFKRIASATVVDNINTPVIDSRPINSNELNVISCSQPEYKQDIADQANDQLNNILEKQQQQQHSSRHNLKEDNVNEKLDEVLIEHNKLAKENPKQYNQSSTDVVLNGFNCSNTIDSRPVEPANSYKERNKFNPNDSPIIAVSNDTHNNFVQIDVANISNSQKKSANPIVSNCSSINSVNTTKTSKIHFVPHETTFQHKNQDTVNTLTLVYRNQQRSGLYISPYTRKNNCQSSLGKSTINNYPLKSPTHHYQSIGDVVRTVAPSTVNSISIIHSPPQSKMQYQQSQNEASHTPGRYVCPYCQLNCTKPSVLQKQ